MIKGLFALAFMTPILNQDFRCKNQGSAAIMKLLMKFSRIIHDDPDPDCAKNTWCRCPHLAQGAWPDTISDGGKHGEIDLPLIVDWPNRPKQMVCHETGKPAVTEFKRMSVTDGQSRLRLFPKTGRSHQLRVHCLAIGHPILGDPLYAPETVADFPRLLLHSEELRINHPESGKGLRFRAKCPF